MKDLFLKNKKVYIELLILFALFLFMFISVFIDAKFINTIDRNFFEFVIPFRCKFLDVFFYFFTFIGEPVFGVVVLLILLLFNKDLMPQVLSAISFVVNDVIKRIVKRDRPIEFFHSNNLLGYKLPSTYSFPSGHAQTSSAIYLMIGIILYKKYNKKTILILFSIFTSFIGISRIYFGVHNLSDVLTGWIILVIFIIIFKKSCKNNTKV